MGLLSIFKRQDPPPRRPRQPATRRRWLQVARTRARRRLIGAVVLLGIGVIALSAAVRDAAATDSGRHPDRDPAQGCARRRWWCRRARGPRASAAASAPRASRAPAAPQRRAASAPARPPNAAAADLHRRPAPRQRSRRACRQARSRRCQARAEAPVAAPSRADSRPSPRRPPRAAGRFVVQVGAFADASGAARRARPRSRNWA